MWNAKKSTVLSLVMTYVCAAALIAMMFIAPSFLNYWYNSFQSLVKTVLVVFYCCCPIAFAAIYCLLRLLSNIRKEYIFENQNVSLLRLLSWCCFGVTLVTFIGGILYLPFYLVAGSSLFLGLILRVVKNVIAAAVEIKTENELTV
jgi:hypothetical protein